MTPNTVEPAIGAEIRLSKRKFFIVFAILVIAFVFGIVSIWAWWTETPLPLPLFGERNNRWGGMTGAFMVAISGLFIPVAIAYYFAKEKLIVAADRLQIVQSNKVVAQFPYRNIAKVALDTDEGVEFLGIDLKDSKDPETLAEVWDFEGHKADDGWHYSIQGVYERELDDICNLIEEHLAKSRTP